MFEVQVPLRPDVKVLKTSSYPIKTLRSDVENVQVSSVADLHSKILDTRPLGLIFFIYMQFSPNFDQIIGWYPTFDLAPLLGNPGSAACYYI